ncbi:MAG: FHA domain-containing protein, partial [Fimbriimonadaceae bacterium]|nr:FHA domain-containing protein [Fimbriimonadaceae bacterium]
MPVLVDEAGREHTLRPGENILGRQGDIALDDARVSRRHASINVGEDLILKDLGSTNGTKLGNDPITAPALLEQGSVVSLGGFKLTLSLPGVSAKTAMPIGGQTIQTPPPTTSP